MSDEEDNIDDSVEDVVPDCLRWNESDVADFIEKLGFPYYRETFISNKITGRRLILIEASALPRIGITDYIHIKEITNAIRNLLKIEYPDAHKSISLPPRESLGMFLEKKCPTGEKADALKYGEFLENIDEYKWRPPLSNHIQILPHC